MTKRRSKKKKRSTQKISKSFGKKKTKGKKRHEKDIKI